MELPSGLNYVGPSGSSSFVTRPVLEFLWGQRWDAVAASWVSTLQPLVVRHSPDGYIQLSAIAGRVTVFTRGTVRPLIIESIEMECDVDLYGEIQHGDDLEQRTRKIRA